MQEIDTQKQAIRKSQENKAECFREKEKLSMDIREQMQVLLGLGEENNNIRGECGFEDLDIGPLISGQEKEELLAREKVNEISRELALLLRAKESLVQTLSDLGKEKADLEKTSLQCRADIGITNREIEENRKNILRIEEENKGLKEKMGLKKKLGLKERQA